MMCEPREAIRARKNAADQLTRACCEQAGVLATAFGRSLAEPIPDALRKLADEAERRLRQ